MWLAAIVHHSRNLSIHIPGWLNRMLPYWTRWDGGLLACFNIARPVTSPTSFELALCERFAGHPQVFPSRKFAIHPTAKEFVP